MRRTGMLLLPLLLCSSALAAQASRFAGTWTFTVSGGDTGSGVAEVDSTGRIRGRGLTDLGGPITLAGSVGADGAMALTASPSGQASTAATFQGRADAAGKASGTWTNLVANTNGSWQATRSPGRAAPATGMACEAGTGPLATDRFAPVQVSASYYPYPAPGRAYLVILARKPSPAVENWTLVVHALPVTGAGAAPIVKVPGSVSTISHRNARQGSPDQRRAEGVITFTTLSGPPRGGPGRMAGAFDMEAAPYRVHCTFDLTAADFGPAVDPRTLVTPP